MNPDVHAHLLKRGYTEALIKAEEITSCPPGKNMIISGVVFSAHLPGAVFTCRTASGAVAGLHLAPHEVKDYQWRQNKKAPWLPICYATPEDWEILGRTGELLLTEGVYDRVAVKRAVPDRAVMARLSKSIRPIEAILRRYTRHLWVLFDQDERGDQGARQAARLESRSLEVTRVRFRGGDPSEHLRDHGLKDLKRWVEPQLEAL